MRTQPPPFFPVIRDRARARWDQLEDDEELAGPWRLLFEQVQRPRHVLSELLQNADDVGARRATAAVEDGVFVFEHDGRDFTEEEFSSLCSFAFSNKRSLHTIGFRGVGFKSTFSLGDAVDVTTPTLAVRFLRERFTEPVWVDGSDEAERLPGGTRITVRIADANRQAELEKNLKEWIESPASLLFFAHLEELTVEGETLRKERLGEGPVPGSERIALDGGTRSEVVLFRSAAEPFPEEALAEIRQERVARDLELPPCRVEIVLGLQGDQRLYVVLPTQVGVHLPFSCNAPFIQDPARDELKPPSLSPTNRWLLERAGRFAAHAMHEWLAASHLDVEARAVAYQLLPEKPGEAESTSAECTSAIAHAFAEAVDEAAILLTTDGRLAEARGCLAPPSRTYHIWSPGDLAAVFGEPGDDVIAASVDATARSRLSSWGWLDLLKADDLISRLNNGGAIPRPHSNEQLLLLWGLVEERVGSNWIWRGDDFCRRLRIVPTPGSPELSRAEDLVRLPRKSEAIDEASWAFLRDLVEIADNDWTTYLDSAADNQVAGKARDLLRRLGLARPSDMTRVFRMACHSFAVRSGASVDEHVVLAHLAAALDVEFPADAPCVTRDGRVRRAGENIVASTDPVLEELVPADWAQAHLLHDRYFDARVVRDDVRWATWLTSGKSPFFISVPVVTKRIYIRGRQALSRLLDSRHASGPRYYPYVTSDFEMCDVDFAEELVQHWHAEARTDCTVWAKLLAFLLGEDQEHLQGFADASFVQIATTGTRQGLGGECNAEWIDRFRRLPCLRDTQGQVRLPAELCRRTPDTEPFLGVEPFVAAELDTPATAWLLDRLGVRTGVTDFRGSLQQIRDLREVEDTDSALAPLVSWYGVLDKVLARCTAEEVAQVREAFESEQLTLTASLDWARPSEVFRAAGGGDGVLDVPLVHPAVRDLTLWSRLGVADRPTADVIVAYLHTLQSGVRLGRAEARRVGILAASCAVRVWNECGHWPSLDNTWTPVADLRFRLSPSSRTRWSELSPRVRAATADCRRLSAEVSAGPPFDSLTDLDEAVEYRLTKTPRSMSAAQRPWVRAFATLLMRVELPTDEETERVRLAARRLRDSLWHSLTTLGDLEVTPYVDGVPEGQPFSPKALWKDESVYVVESKLADSYDDIVAELAKPFGHEKVTEAIKACVERDETFVRAYVSGHFDLCEEAELPEPEAASVVPSGGPHVPPSAAEADALAGGGWTGRPEPRFTLTDVSDDEVAHVGPLAADRDADDSAGFASGPGGGRRRGAEHRTPDVLERWALTTGFVRDHTTGGFVGQDGERRLVRNDPVSPFPWRVLDADGAVVVELWVAGHSLQEGVEVPVEVWSLVRQEPERYSLLLLDEGESPALFRGPEIVRRLEEKTLQVFPSKYRIRVTEDG